MRDLSSLCEKEEINVWYGWFISWCIKFYWKENYQ